MLLPIALAIAVAAAPAKSSAKKAEPAPKLSDDPSARAKELFGWASKLYQQARYAEAISKFEEAYALKPHPVIHFNIGKCWEQLGETGKALRSYRDYLRLLPDAKDKETVSDAIANLERRLKEKGVQQLLVFADPQTAKISVDGNELGTSPASVELQAGNHKLTVKADGYETVERSFVMNTTRSTEMTINLRPVQNTPAVSDAPKAEPKAELTPAPSTTPPDLVVTEEPRPKGRVFTWVAAGGAVVAAGAGVTMGLMSNAAGAELRGSQHTREQADALVGRANAMGTGANIAYAVAGAAALTAVILFFVEG